MNSQRKILILIIVLFIMVLVGLFFAYQLFIPNNKTNDFKDIRDTASRNTLFPISSLFNGGGDKGTQQSDFIPKLRQISSAPTAGGVILNTEEGVIIRYVERSTGHIFEATTRSLEQNRISNTTIPRIQESVWSHDGEMVILQYLDENEVLKSFYGKVSGEAGMLDGWFLSNNITNIDVHEDGDIFYIQRIGNSAKGIVSNFDGTNNKTVFSSKIYDWIPQWMNNSITVTTKASNNIDGFLYQLQSGILTKLISFNGLITNINNDGTKILFSISNTDGTDLLIYDSNTKEITEVPFTALAEKCVWANNSTFFCASPHNEIFGVVPDDFYKGALLFSDDIWVFNTETKTEQLIYDAKAEGKNFNMINLAIDDEQKMLMFTNKEDLSLWSLSLE